MSSWYSFALYSILLENEMEMRRSFIDQKGLNLSGIISMQMATQEYRQTPQEKRTE